MELELSQEQAAFVETTRRFLAAECPIERTRSLEHEPAGFETATWAHGARLGWTSLLVSAADGGGSFSADGLSDLVLVAEEMGRMVAPGPLLPVNVVADAVSRHGTAEQRGEVLPGLLSGEQVAACCDATGAVGRFDGNTIVLDGTCEPVEAAGQADHLLVTVRTGDDLTQVLIAADTPGVHITAMAGLDLVRRFASVRFDGVVVATPSVLGPIGGAAAQVERQLAIACVLQCAETVGAIDRVFEMTLEYLGDRYSFGRPLSSYQALKHRIADDKTWLEACHAIATAAARAVAEGAPDAAQVVSAAKAWIGPHASELIQDCIQLHGGIGVTWEHDLHLYLRRVTVNRSLHGTPEDHHERIAAELLGAAS